MARSSKGNYPSPGIRVGESGGGGTSNRFAKTGKAKPAQFAPKSPGNVEKGWKQKTPKTATAAMQGRAMGSPPTKAKPKNKGSKQFTRAPGKSVF